MNDYTRPFGDSLQPCSINEDCVLNTSENPLVSKALYGCFPLNETYTATFCACNPLLSAGGEVCRVPSTISYLTMATEWLFFLYSLYLAALFFFLSLLRDGDSTRNKLFSFFAATQSLSTILWSIWNLSITTFFFSRPGSLIPGIDFGVIQTQLLGPLAFVLMVAGILFLLTCWLQTFAKPQHLMKDSSLQQIQLGLIAFILILFGTLFATTNLGQHYAPNQIVTAVALVALSCSVLVLQYGKRVLLAQINHTKREVLPNLEDTDAISRSNVIAKVCSKSIINLSNGFNIGYMLYLIGAVMYVVGRSSSWSFIQSDNVSGVLAYSLAGILNKLGGLYMRFVMLRNGRDALYGDEEPGNVFKDIVQRPFQITEISTSKSKRENQSQSTEAEE